MMGFSLCLVYIAIGLVIGRLFVKSNHILSDDPMFAVLTALFWPATIVCTGSVLVGRVLVGRPR